MVMTVTASYFGLLMDDLRGSSETRLVARARQIAMYLCRELTDVSLVEIGRQFGGRDYLTVMHARKRVRVMMSQQRSVYNAVADLTSRITSQCSLTGLGDLRS